MTAYDFYTSRAETLLSQINKLKTRNRLFITAELAEFAAVVALLIVFFSTDAGEQTLWAAAAVFAVYIITRRGDARNSALIEAKEAQRQVYVNETKYLKGDFSAFFEGSPFIDPHHPFSFDLDIFGPQSIYNRMCRCATTGGQKALASAMSSVKYDAKRGETIEELKANEPFRTAFVATTKGETANSDQTAEALKGLTGVSVAKVWKSNAARIITIVDVVAYLAYVILAACNIVGASVAIWWGVANMCLSIGLSHKTLGTIAKSTDRTARQIGSITTLISLIDAQDFKAHELKYLQEQLASASDSFRQMFQMAHKLENRANMLALILGNIFLLSDLRLMLQFARWEHANATSTDSWLKAVAQMDMLVSMGTFAYNEPTAKKAQITEGDGITVEAKGLWHPFLGEKAVRNDFNISDGQFYIITGANMAGKSTFLRAVGVNYILAINSLPVFAESFKATKFNLFTSMRTSDDLTHGISYFNAELLRLQELINNVKAKGRTLIILDEILKGTNSLDKLNGSLLFLRTMLSYPVSGIIATHDLGLAKLTDEDPARFCNYCFEIEIGSDITYSYKIAKAVARNQNATFLLNKLLKKE